MVYVMALRHTFGSLFPNPKMAISGTTTRVRKLKAISRVAFDIGPLHKAEAETIPELEVLAYIYTQPT